MKRVIGSVLLFVFAFSTFGQAVGGNKAQYVGGTLTGVREKSDGTFTLGATDAVFVSKEATVTISYAAITELEYGQKAGRRVAVAVLVSPLALFSKKRNHYLTVTFKDHAGAEQAAVFELGKEIVRTTLKVLEVRSGNEIQYQDGPWVVAASPWSRTIRRSISTCSISRADSIRPCASLPLHRVMRSRTSTSSTPPSESSRAARRMSRCSRARRI
jgi:hypothetical protein